MRIAWIAALAFFIAQAPASKGVIEGRVVHPGTHEPISDVLVTLVAPLPANAASNLAPDAAARLSDQITSLTESGNRAGVSQEAIDNAIENARRNAGASAGHNLTAMTDASGHFRFGDLAPGRYTVRAEKDSYFAQPINGSASTVLTKTITIQDGKTNAPEDLLMVKGAVISGRVRDPNGQPISAMNVSVYRVTYTNGRKIWTASNSKATDDRGEYRIYWLFPGEYYVGVTPRVPGPTPGPQDTWARTLFPGVTEPADAMSILLKDGSEAAGTDISIRAGTSATFKISGVAINSVARPNPTTGAVDRSISSFVLAPRDPGVLDSLNPPSVVNALPTASRQNGEFELRNIRPGAYDLYPLAPVITDQGTAPAAPGAVVSGTTALPAQGNIVTVQIIGGVAVTTSSPATAGGVPTIRRQPTSRTPVEVNRDIPDLRIVVSAGVLLSGEVVVNGTTTTMVKPESIRLSLRNLDSMPASFTSLIGTIPVDSAGRFSVPGVPEARYTFQVSGLPGNAYVADIRQGGTSVMDNGFVLDQAANPVQLVIEPNGATMQGTVLNGDGKPAVNATVALVPSSHRQNTLLYRNVTTNEDGKFTLKGVPQGQYTAFAWESVLPTAWQNAEFIARYESRGHPLSVTASSTADVQLSLIPSEDSR